MMQSNQTPWAVALCLCGLVTATPATAEETAETAAEVAAAAVIAEEEAVEEPALEPASTADISYSIGFTIGDDMKRRTADLDTDEIIKGIRAGLGEEEARLSIEQISQCLFSFQLQMQEKMMAQAQESLEKGQAYLEANAQEEGVTVTDSGLQYKVIASGDGATPTMGDIVSANYRGTLVDGTEFDSSPEGEPVQFPVARVIPGWTEALQLMKVGDKWELTIPAELGYGEYGSQDGAIGPNETLIFQIELVGIN